MTRLLDLSDVCVVVTADGDRWRTVFEPAVRAASADDGRSLVPERIDPASGFLSDDDLDRIESGAVMLVDLFGLPPDLFALLAWTARMRPRSVVLMRPTGVALPYAVHEFAVRTLDVAAGPAALRESVARWATLAASARVREDALGARLSSPGSARALRGRRERRGVAIHLRLAMRALLSGDAAAALFSTRSAFEADPSSADLALREALLRKDVGSWVEATAALDRALALDEQLAPAWRELGLVRERAGVLGVEAALRRAVDLSGDFSALVALAFRVQRDGRTEEALGYFERANEAAEGQLNLVLPAVVLRAAQRPQRRPARCATASVSRRFSRFAARRRSSAPPADVPWSFFDAATAHILLGDAAAAARLASAARAHVHAAWQGDAFGRTLGALEAAGLDAKAVREAAGLPPARSRPRRGPRPRRRACRSRPRRATRRRSRRTCPARRPAPSAPTPARTWACSPAGRTRTPIAPRAARTRSRPCAPACAPPPARTPAAAARSTSRSRSGRSSAS